MVKNFRAFVQKILPAVYDDTLSYYELLSKVIAKLNEVINSVNNVEESIGGTLESVNEQVESVQTALELLKDQVDNYLDTLDITSDVNNKLDAMVQDGTLEALINQTVLENIASASAEALAKVQNFEKTFQNKNILDNWYFANPVNQRGNASYGGAGYTIDRWIAGTNTTVALTESGLSITTPELPYIANLTQRLENTFLLDEQSVTVSILMDDGSMVSRTGVASKTAALDTPTINLVHGSLYWDANISNYVFVISSASTSADNPKIIAAKLEIGTMQTLAYPKDGGLYGLRDVPKWDDELRACQRYYQKIRSFQGYGRYNETSDKCILFLVCPTPLRKSPSVMIVECELNVNNTIYALASNTVATVSASSIYNNVVCLSAEPGSSKPASGVLGTIQNSVIELSADL